MDLKKTWNTVKSQPHKPTSKHVPKHAAPAKFSKQIKSTGAKKDVKFSIPNKKEFRKLLSTHEEKIKAGDVLLVFKDGHWKAVSSKEPALKKLGNILNYTFSKEYVKDAGKFSKAMALAPKHIYTGEWRHFDELNEAGVITGGVLYSIPLATAGTLLVGEAASAGIFESSVIAFGKGYAGLLCWTFSVGHLTPVIQKTIDSVDRKK